MRFPASVVAVFLITACAPASEGAELAPAPVEVVGRRCLDLERVAAQRPDGSRSILFETAGGAWRNTLPEACPGLERPASFVTLVFEPRTGPLCRNDFVRAVDSNQLGTLGAASAPRCRLGDFTLQSGTVR